MHLLQSSHESLELNTTEFLPGWGYHCVSDILVYDNMLKIPDMILHRKGLINKILVITFIFIDFLHTYPLYKHIKQCRNCNRYNIIKYYI